MRERELLSLAEGGIDDVEGGDAHVLWAKKKSPSGEGLLFRKKMRLSAHLGAVDSERRRTCSPGALSFLSRRASWDKLTAG
jgi:hypothetical protein